MSSDPLAELEKIGHYVPTVFKEEDASRVVKSRSETVLKFPKYREKYYRDNFEAIVQLLEKHTIECDVHFLRGEIKVSTSEKLFDPTKYFDAIDFIKLISRGMSMEDAEGIFDEEMTSAIVPLAQFCKSKKIFVNRRNRLFGPDGVTLKAIQLLTKAKIVLQGGTMAVLGNDKGVQRAVKIATDAMNNIHPVLNINKFMVIKELENNPEMKGKDWSSIVPKVQKQGLTRKERAEKSKKDQKTFTKKKAADPLDLDRLLPQKSKIDLQIESGEYFMEKEEREKKNKSQRKSAQNAKSAEKKIEKEKKFIAPTENKHKKVDKSKNKEKKINANDLKLKMKS